MSLTTKVLLGLILGLAVGIGISASGNAALLRVPAFLEPIGTLWINAIRMTVIPLVISAILVGVTSLPDAKTIGRIGGRALLLFLIALFVAAAFTVIVAPPVFAGLDIDPAAAAALRASVATTSGAAVENAQRIQGFRQWLIDLVPTNPIKAAADGAMLPLIVFSLAFGLGLNRITPANRDVLLRGINAVLEASLTLVRWILKLAPIGVFALTVALANRLGLAAAGAVLYYIVVVSAMLIAFMALLYLVAWLIGGKSPRLFARACAPAQAVAFSSRSSLVALPALLETSQTILRLPLPIRSFFLPLAVATFRCGSAIGIPVGVLFLARLYGIDLSVQQLVSIALTSVVTTFSVPGIPGGSIIVMVPVLLAAGLPVDGIGLLLGVDTVPDMFRTTTNVTADMAAACVLSKHEGEDSVISEGEPVVAHPHPEAVARVAESGITTS